MMHQEDQKNTEQAYMQQVCGEIRKDARSMMPYAVQVREILHRRPELAFHEYHTSAFIRQELERMGIPYETVGETGIIGIIRGSGADAAQGRTVAIRTDLDALPVKEETGCSFSSENENMHACGHDLHMAMLLSAAHILNGRRAQLNGTVKLIFQPAEEVGKGAQFMVSSGKLDGTDAVFGLHMDPQTPVGIIKTGKGPRTTMGCWFRVTITGADGDRSADTAVPAAAELIRIIHAKLPAMGAGEGAFTLTPTVVKTDENGAVTVSFDGRVYRGEDGDRLEALVEQVCQSLRESRKAEISVQTGRVSRPVVNDAELTAFAAETITDLFGAEALNLSPPAAFGEDFCYYADTGAKLVFSMLGGKTDGEAYPLHNSKVTFSEDAMYYGIAYEAALAELYLH